MPQIISCSCGKKYKVDDAYAGRAVKCKACGRSLLVPAGLKPAPEPEAEVGYDLAGAEADGGIDPARAEADFRPAPPGPRGHPAPPPIGGLVRLGMNPRTVASNPARTRLNVGKFISCYPSPFVVFGVMILAGVLGAVVKHPGFLILTALGLAIVFRYLGDMRRKLRTGDVNPAVVISTRPWRIAVYTDLSTGRGPRPCIKIINAPLGRMTGGAPAEGARLAVVSLYAGRMSTDAWRTFEPTVLACAVANPADIARVTASIPAAEWRRLEQFLQQVPARKPGLYRMW